MLWLGFTLVWTGEVPVAIWLFCAEPFMHTEAMASLCSAVKGRDTACILRIHLLSSQAHSHAWPAMTALLGAVRASQASSTERFAL